MENYQPNQQDRKYETVALGGGCFWCTEAVFVQVRGITDVESGYCNGHVPNPGYEAVCTGTTGHAEVVQLCFDTAQIGLQQILEIFFLIHDPTTPNRQGNDRGPQYRSGIYCTTSAQLTQAKAFIEHLEQKAYFSAPIVTEVLPLKNYWPAEDYHQDFFAKNPGQGYCMAVAQPKVEKFRATFKQWAKP